jgi:hypothetical protein
MFGVFSVNRDLSQGSMRYLSAISLADGEDGAELGGDVGPHTTPTSPQISPGPTPVLGSMRWKKWGVLQNHIRPVCPVPWHLPDIPSCFPSFVRGRILPAPVSSHSAPDCQKVLPCLGLTAPKPNEANGPSGADTQTREPSYHNKGPYHAMLVRASSARQ